MALLPNLGRPFRLTFRRYGCYRRPVTPTPPSLRGGGGGEGEGVEEGFGDPEPPRVAHASSDFGSHPPHTLIKGGGDGQRISRRRRVRVDSGGAGTARGRYPTRAAADWQDNADSDACSSCSSSSSSSSLSLSSSSSSGVVVEGGGGQKGGTCAAGVPTADTATAQTPIPPTPEALSEAPPRREAEREQWQGQEPPPEADEELKTAVGGMALETQADDRATGAGVAPPPPPPPPQQQQQQQEEEEQEPPPPSSSPEETPAPPPASAEDPNEAAAAAPERTMQQPQQEQPATAAAEEETGVEKQDPPPPPPPPSALPPLSPGQRLRRPQQREAPEDGKRCARDFALNLTVMRGIGEALPPLIHSPILSHKLTTFGPPPHHTLPCALQQAAREGRPRVRPAGGG
jgi:hypothetical protein